MTQISKSLKLRTINS